MEKARIVHLETIDFRKFCWPVANGHQFNFASTFKFVSTLTSIAENVIHPSFLQKSTILFIISIFYPVMEVYIFPMVKDV